MMIIQYIGIKRISQTMIIIFTIIVPFNLEFSGKMEGKQNYNSCNKKCQIIGNMKCKPNVF